MSDVLNAKYYNKKIEIKCIVSGKSISPYTIPKEVEFKCYTKNSDRCCKCKYNSNKTYTIEATDENILKFIDIKSNQISKVLQSIVCPGCKITDYIVIKMQNVERIFILPMAGRERSKIKLAPISYYIGHDIDVNKTYNMSGYTTVDPTNQTTIHIFDKAEKIKSDVETFVMKKSIHKELMQFTIDNATVDKIFDYLDKLYTYYSHNITKIYNRFDLHLCVDLVFKSVLSFKFNHEVVKKGWVDCIIVGDTRCGKGFVAEKLLNYFGVGEVVGAENCSFSGLVGGLQQLHKHWTVTWGKIPLNDCGLVVIDEASEIPHKDWTRLSRIRSEGIAEITKINTQITNARTRTIFLANPISKIISNYSYGIQSITDIVKASEDIARFDYALVVAHNEVSIEDINKHRNEIAKEICNSKLEQQLILWTWSKKINEIQFSDEAIKLIYKYSIELAEVYSFSIPLIQGENIRIKIAKLSICFASRFYSNKEQGKILYVDTVHVKCVLRFFDLIYKKSVSGYYDMSNFNKSLNINYNDFNFRPIDKYFDAYTLNKNEIFKCLLQNNNISLNDLTDHINQPIEISREIISKLLKHNCITKHGQFYIKMPVFTEYLKNKISKYNKED